MADKWLTKLLPIVTRHVFFGCQTCDQSFLKFNSPFTKSAQRCPYPLLLSNPRLNVRQMFTYTSHTTVRRKTHSLSKFTQGPRYLILHVIPQAKQSTSSPTFSWTKKQLTNPFGSNQSTSTPKRQQLDRHILKASNISNSPSHQGVGTQHFFQHLERLQLSSKLCAKTHKTNGLIAKDLLEIFLIW